jgi:hypothetical protein
MPGGHGSASFEVPVANAFLRPHHVLYEGAWIKIYDDAHELYEGEISSVKPSVDSSGQHKLAVTCGGLISVAGKRADVSATWVHRGAADWKQHDIPGYTTVGQLRSNMGPLELRLPVGTDATGSNVCWMRFNLDDRLSDDRIHHIAYTMSWDMTGGLIGSIYTQPGTGAAAEFHVETNTSGTDVPGTLTPNASCQWVDVYIVGGGHAVDKWISFDTFDIFGMGRTTKPRIDEAMVDLATRPGLATSYLSEPVGAMLDDLHVGNGLDKTSAAGAMGSLASLFAQPFEHGFWDNRTFICRPQPRTPRIDAQVIVVGGGNPGLELWEVAEYDEDVPQYACVLFGNKDDTTVVEGWPRRLYRPSTPPDDADLRIETINHSSLILSDANAAAVGDNLVAVASSGIPTGQIFDAHPVTANAGKWPGNNTDPTALYQDNYSVLVQGTLSGFAYTPASGWTGTNTPADPCRLVGDGVNDYVDFGDVASCDFGTGAFSVRKWLKLNALPAAGTVAIGASKLDGARGWSLGVTSNGRLRGYVGGSGAVAPTPSVTATGTVTTTTDGTDTVHKFTGNGSLVVSAGDTITGAEVLVVGGGAGGSSGGGGAGGYLTGTETLTGTMAIVVGPGGGGRSVDSQEGDRGTDSSFGTRTALGGGGGGRTANSPSGAVGGSGGGGGGGDVAHAGASGTAGQGHNGGSSSADAGGGGGGQSAVGATPNGGAGINSDIVLRGTNVGYAGGGGGGDYTGAGSGGTASHGGGAGGTSSANGTNGTANTGGGGGGAGTTKTGGNGGKGIVVVRYPTPTAASNCRQQTGGTVLALDTWYHVTMTYAGSGGDIALSISGVAESLTAAGAVGAHDLSNAGNLKLFKGTAAVYASAALGRVTVWSRALTLAEQLADAGAGQEFYERSLAKGTVVLKGLVRNRQGALVPAHHIRAGWWIQNIETGSTKPLYITGHSVDLADKKNALTIGVDWMEKEIGVRMAELLAIPATVVPDAVTQDSVDPYTPDNPDDPGVTPDDPAPTDPPVDPMTPPPWIGPAPPIPKVYEPWRP